MQTNQANRDLCSFFTYFDQPILEALLESFTHQEALLFTTAVAPRLDKLHEDRERSKKVPIKEDKRYHLHASILSSYISTNHSSHPNAAKLINFVAEYTRLGKAEVITSNASKLSAEEVIEGCNTAGRDILLFYLEKVKALPQYKMIMAYYKMYTGTIPITTLLQDGHGMFPPKVPEASRRYFVQVSLLQQCILMAAGIETCTRIERECSSRCKEIYSEAVKRKLDQTTSIGEPSSSSPKVIA